jgi:hypothetical protein
MFIERNLNSIKKLDIANKLEIIVIDNHSTDDTLKILKTYQKSLNLKIFKLNKNQGFAKACNLGVEKSEGDFIFITNQDVIFPKDFFKNLLNSYSKIKKRKEVVISPAIIFEGNGIHYYGAKIHFLGFSYTVDISKQLPLKKKIIETKRFSGGSLFLKKNLFESLGGFDHQYFI